MLLSEDFVDEEKGEELFSGDSVVQKPKGLFKSKKLSSMEYTLEQIENWCRLRKFPKEQIEEAKRDFIKQSLFNKLVNRTDETNKNFGLVVSKGNVKLAPGFDYDHSFSTMKIPVVRRTVNGKDSSIEGFVQYYSKYEWFRNWLPEAISKIDIEQVLEGEDIQEIAYVYRNEVEENKKRIEEAYKHMGSGIKNDSEINVER